MGSVRCTLIKNKFLMTAGIERKKETPKKKENRRTPSRQLPNETGRHSSTILFFPHPACLVAGRTCLKNLEQDLITAEVPLFLFLVSQDGNSLKFSTSFHWNFQSPERKLEKGPQFSSSFPQSLQVRERPVQALSGPILSCWGSYSAPAHSPDSPSCGPGR